MSGSSSGSSSSSYVESCRKGVRGVLGVDPIPASDVLGSCANVFSYLPL